MTLPSFRRTLPAPVLLGSLLVLACGTPAPTETKPDLPQVSVLVDEPSTVGKSLKLSLSTSGCDKVQKLELFDGDALLKTVTYTGSPTAVELQINEVRYSLGIAANLSLTARVTCADGRTNVSQAQPATFLPVAEVIEPPSATDQVVPDYFIAEGSGESTVFYGCGKIGARSFFYRIKKSNPNAFDSLEMPFACDETTLVTERKPTGSGWRWVWTPNKGAIAVDTNFKITADSLDIDGAFTVYELWITPDGGALISDGTSLQRLSNAGKLLWRSQNDTGSPGAEIFTAPVVRTGGTAANTIAVARQEFSSGATITNVRVSVFRYDDGTFQQTYNVASIPTNQPVYGVLDATGAVLYLSLQGDTSVAIQACAVGQTALCKAGSATRLWISDDIKGSLVAMVPYNNGSRMGIITPNSYWFLDIKTDSPTRGKTLNKDQKPLVSTGSLVARYAQPGLNDSSFYLFTGAASSSSNPNPAPVEIVATDSAEQGLLYRYQTPGASLYGAVDDSGAFWLRVGRKLFKPLTPAQYRQCAGKATCSP